VVRGSLVLSTIGMLAVAGGFALSAPSGASDPEVGLVVESPSGVEQGFCLEGGSYEFHSPGDQWDERNPRPTYEDSRSAVDAFIGEIQTAASSRNPMLEYMSPNVRDFWLEQFRLHYKPVERLQLPVVEDVSDDTSTFSQYQSGSSDGKTPNGTMDWYEAQAVVRYDGNTHWLESVIICTDAIVDRVGQAWQLSSDVTEGEEP
jgi:hypothetical protein